MYRIIVILKSLALELKKSKKKVIQYDDITNTMTFQMADSNSKDTIFDIVNGMKQTKTDENKQFVKKDN